MTIAKDYATALCGARAQLELINIMRSARNTAISEGYSTPSIARNVKLLDELTFADGSVLEIKYDQFGLMNDYIEKVKQ